MWAGYLTVGGMEVANAGRVEAYVGSTPWFKPIHDAEDLHQALDEEPYRTPLLDGAPWVDAAQPSSIDFYGFYLLDATGAEDSSRNVVFTEVTGNGGRPSRVRHNSKTIVFDGVLIGCTEAAVDYGMRWLRAALLDSPCAGTSIYTCAGSNLCYFAYPPCTTETDDPTCWDEATMSAGRTLRKFAVTTGPTVTTKQKTTDGAVIWRVTFTGQAGVPWEYGFERCIVDRFGDPAVLNPYCGDINGTFTFDPYFVDDDDSPCATQVQAPIYDPECQPMQPPPTVPSIDDPCFTEHTKWDRMRFTIPDDVVPIWTDMVPVLTVTTKKETRNLRVRFYADTGSGNEVSDQCAFCGDFLFTYLPKNAVTTLDGATETVTVVTQNSKVPRNAGTLVYGADGGPFEWPLLSCGTGYIVTLDLPQDRPTASAAAVRAVFPAQSLDKVGGWGGDEASLTWGTSPYVDSPDQGTSGTQSWPGNDLISDFGDVPAGPISLVVQAYPHTYMWMECGFTEFTADASGPLIISDQVPLNTWGTATFTNVLTHPGGPLRLYWQAFATGSNPVNTFSEVSYLAVSAADPDPPPGGEAQTDWPIVDLSLIPRAP